MGGVNPLWLARPLSRVFYARPTEQVARELLGKIIVRRLGDVELAGRIIETEAYLGGDDQAAHSFAGLTTRTRAIFGPPGHAYVYLSYGIHHCLNFVAEEAGKPGCVLIRALEPLEGLEQMRRRRPKARSDADLTSGPGKLTAALGITLDDYGTDLTRGSLTVRESRANNPHKIEVTPRIGITKSADLPLRFLLRE